MYGANVGELRDLAAAFESAAGRLDTGRVTVARRIELRLWRGPVADRFRGSWQSQYARLLQVAADQLRTAGRDLRANADEQELTSAASTVTAAPAEACREAEYTPGQTQEYEHLLELLKLGLKAKGATTDGDDLIAALQAGRIDYKSFSTWLGDVKGLDAGALFDLVGLGISGKEFADALGGGSAADQLQSGLEVVIGAVGLKVPGAGLAYDFGKMLGETGYKSLQQIYDSPGSALDYAARSVYGEHATFETLSQDQRDILMERYEGWPGLAVTVGDSIGGAWDDFWRWVTTGRGRGPSR
jgi:hypothetical protein